MILAIVLSVLVIVGWTFASERFLPKAVPPRVAATQPAGPIATQPANPVAVAPDGAVVPAVGGAGQLRDRGAVLAETPRVAIVTPRLSGSINLKGARIDDLVLKGYKETIKPGSPDVRLLAPSGAPAAYFAGFGWSGTDAPPADALWTASAPTLTPHDAGDAERIRRRRGRSSRSSSRSTPITCSPSPSASPTRTPCR